MSQNLIQRLRNKPKETRNTVAFGIAATFTLVVFGVWTVSSTGEFGEMMEGTKKGASAFSTLINHAKREVTEVSESLPSTEELEAAIASSSEATTRSTDVTPGNATTAATSSEIKREVRIATTTTATTSVATSTASSY